MSDALSTEELVKSLRLVRPKAKYEFAKDEFLMIGVVMRQAADEIERLRGALRELVECKDLKYRIECWEAGSTQELAAMAEEYDRRKPKAWEVARKLVKS